jgi:hypothetical protein
LAELLPPMLERDGVHWRVVVQDEDTVFTRFVSARWNEVLNPNSLRAPHPWRLRALRQRPSVRDPRERPH